MQTIIFTNMVLVELNIRKLVYDIVNRGEWL